MMIPIPDPGAMTPEDVDIPLERGPALKAWHWRRDEPRGILLLSHGYGEHAGVYRSFVESVAPTLGLDVLGLDFRGHGRSPGRRGVLGHYEELVDQVLVATRWIARHRPGLPRFVLGQSNGGLAAILAMLREPGEADGLILSNPALRLKMKPPRLKLAAGHVLRIVAPWITLNAPVPIEDLTRDPLQFVVLANDRLVHTRISPPFFFGMLEGGADALKRAGELSLPLLMVVSGADPVIDPDSGRAFFDRYGGADKTLVVRSEMLHHPLVERDREAIYRNIAEWLGPRCSGTSRPGELANPEMKGERV